MISSNCLAYTVIRSPISAFTQVKAEICFLDFGGPGSEKLVICLLLLNVFLQVSLGVSGAQPGRNGCLTLSSHSDAFAPG